jgi:hypothetical protein
MRVVWCVVREDLQPGTHRVQRATEQGNSTRLFIFRRLVLAPEANPHVRLGVIGVHVDEVQVPLLALSQSRPHRDIDDVPLVVAAERRLNDRLFTCVERPLLGNPIVRLVRVRLPELDAERGVDLDDPFHHRVREQSPHKLPAVLAR